ncbi:hypothetical protein TrCOL_g7525 [Triparma columacea]|uniref:C2 domain-containing protein n=2 Tax=Triparma columacea TaxID=722753 RepID=A0A9W7G900_9STRA|nr:hypothetical protein TrCOL_g7525 [Triparma columacea]
MAQQLSQLSQLSKATTGTQIQLSLYANNLKNVAGIGRGVSDPFAVILLQDSSGCYREYGRTSVIKNTLNPSWQEVFTLPFTFGASTLITVAVYDCISGEDFLDLRKHKGMGTASFDVARMIRMGGVTGKRLRRGGAVFATAEIQREGGDAEVAFEVSCLNLKNVAGFLGTSDPFFSIQREVVSSVNSPPKWVTVYSSSPLQNTLNPNFEAVRMSGSMLHNNDPSRRVRFKVEDYVPKGPNKEMGETEPIPFHTMREGMEGTLRNRKAYAISFTSKNGDPRSSKSLHSLHPPLSSAYARCIEAVGRGMDPFCASEEGGGTMAFGFGAKRGVPATVDQCFPIGEEGGVKGGWRGVRLAVDELIRGGVIMSGGKGAFSEAAGTALMTAESMEGKAYVVMAVITEGEPEDVKGEVEAMRAMTEGSNMSIVIVGVGEGEFKELEKEVEGTGIKLTKMGRGGKGGEWDGGEIMELVPGQVEEWAKVMGMVGEGGERVLGKGEEAREIWIDDMDKEEGGRGEI